MACARKRCLSWFLRGNFVRGNRTRKDTSRVPLSYLVQLKKFMYGIDLAYFRIATGLLFVVHTNIIFSCWKCKNSAALRTKLFLMGYSLRILIV